MCGRRGRAAAAGARRARAGRTATCTGQPSRVYTDEVPTQCHIRVGFGLTNRSRCFSLQFDIINKIGLILQFRFFFKDGYLIFRLVMLQQLLLKPNTNYNSF